MRLIDADKLLETLQDLEPHCDNKKYENWVLKMLRCYMPQIINDEPTAYDVDKVVEELEETMQDLSVIEILSHIDFDSTIQSGLDNFLKAYNSELLRIVKKGSVDDDVCEWELASDGEFIQNPHTKRLYSNEPSMQNVYCNTCGKKIKIVGD